MGASVLRVIALLTGAAGAVCFLLPALTARIVNIGNVTGFLVSACLFVYGCRQARVHGLVRAGIRSGPPARILIAAAGLAAAGIAVTAVVLTGMMIRAARKEPAADASVVVLGCEVRGEEPSLMLRTRMDAAVTWLLDHPEAVCVVSGGRGENERISEAECMFRYMTARGIAPDRILLEDRSVSTRENLAFSARILRERGLGKDVAVVTNEFHACRACLIAGSLGLCAGTIPAPSPWWLFPTFYVRELYGLLDQIFL